MSTSIISAGLSLYIFLNSVLGDDITPVSRYSDKVLHQHKICIYLTSDFRFEDTVNLLSVLL